MAPACNAYVLYADQWARIKDLEPLEFKHLVTAMVELGMEGKQPTGLTPLEQCAFSGFEHAIISNRVKSLARSEAGKKGAAVTNKKTGKTVTKKKTNVDNPDPADVDNSPVLAGACAANVVLSADDPANDVLPEASFGNYKDYENYETMNVQESCSSSDIQPSSLLSPTPHACEVEKSRVEIPTEEKAPQMNPHPTVEEIARLVDQMNLYFTDPYEFYDYNIDRGWPVRNLHAALRGWENKKQRECELKLEARRAERMDNSATRHFVSNLPAPVPVWPEWSLVEIVAKDHSIPMEIATAFYEFMENREWTDMNGNAIYYWVPLLTDAQNRLHGIRPQFVIDTDEAIVDAFVEYLATKAVA